MADYAELIAEARAAAEADAMALVHQLADALEATLPRHGLALELVELRAEVERIRTAAEAEYDDHAARQRAQWQRIQQLEAAAGAPAGYLVGWQDGDRTHLALDSDMVGADRGHAHTYGTPADARAYLAEVGPEDPGTAFHVYELRELPDDSVPVDDRAPAESVTAPFETVLQVFLDGVGTGAATALGKVRPDAPARIVDDAAQAIVDQIMVDPLVVEQLRGYIRRRLSGDVTTETTEVRVWGGQ